MKGMIDMSLMKCPECGHDVSTKASTCPNCGAPIEEIAKEVEIKRLMEKIVPTEFTVPKGCRDKVCIKCAAESWATGKPTCKCGFPLVEIDYPIQQGGSLGSLLYIREHDIIPRHIGDEESIEYKREWEKIIKSVKESEEFRKADGMKDWKIEPIPPKEEYMNLPENKPSPDIPPIPEKPVPKCPICGSTNLTKLSAGRKLAKVSLLGIFGAGDIGKAWKCNSCGCRF